MRISSGDVDRFLEQYKDDYPMNGFTCGQIFEAVFDQLETFLLLTRRTNDESRRNRKGREV